MQTGIRKEYCLLAFSSSCFLRAPITNSPGISWALPHPSSIISQENTHSSTISQSGEDIFLIDFPSYQMTLAVSSVHKTSTPTSSQIHSLILTISQKSHRDRGFMVIAIFTLPLEDVSSIFGIINCIITTLKILTSASCMKYHWIALIPTVFLLLAYLEL